MPKTNDAAFLSLAVSLCIYLSVYLLVAGTAPHLTEIASVSYSNIRRGGSVIHDTGAGEWECFPKRPCVNFSMVDVSIAPAKNWKCSYLDKASTRAVGVQPSNGLGDCFREEMRLLGGY